MQIKLSERARKAIEVHPLEAKIGTQEEPSLSLKATPEEWSWSVIGRAEHPGSGKAGLLVKHHPSGRFALDVGRHLLSVNQEWAEAEAARRLQ